VTENAMKVQFETFCAVRRGERAAEKISAA
jgi:hypothetical protein